MHKCRICGWTGEAELLTIREMMYNTRDEFQYFECASCHCLQITEVPDNLGDYYQNTYYSYKPPKGTDKKETDKLVSTRVLDVGCGSGVHLCELADLGYVNLTGCDPFIEQDIVYENGVKIYKRDVHDMTGQYDWINLKDSFEHVTDPHEVMDSLKRLLAPGGAIRMSLPVHPNIAFDSFGVHWYQLDAPRHIFIHTKQSLEYLAENHGLKIVKKEYDSREGQIICSYLYSKDIPYIEQTSEVILRHFSDAEIDRLKQIKDVANSNEYGDHAVFYFTHKAEDEYGSKI